MARAVQSNVIPREESLRLHRLCNILGCSPEGWKRLIWQNDCFATIYKLIQVRKNHYDLEVLCAGSDAEGTAAKHLNSDTDIMLILMGTTVIEDPQSTVSDPSHHVFQLVRTNHPSFVRLQLVSVGDGQNTELNPRRISTPNLCTSDDQGRFILIGSLVKYHFRNGDIDSPLTNGPNIAFTISVGDFDKVPSLRLQSWPSTASEWVTRFRPYNCPSQETIQFITQKGCLLVPVGNPCSRFKDLEWRLSFSYAEKILIRLFNICQIQCLALMKLVLVYVLKPTVPNSLCSYHMKTVVLHVVENTDPREWTIDNLARCFMKCLNTLYIFLREGNCPHYFIPEHNLFVPKVQGDNRQRLLSLVADLVREGWKCVLRCAPLSSEGICEQTLHTERPECQCFLNFWQLRTQTETAGTVFYLLSMFSVTMGGHMREIMQTSCTVTELVQRMSDSFKSACFYGNTEEVVADVVRCFQHHCGSHLGYTLICLAQNSPAFQNRDLYKVFKLAERLLDQGCEVDLSAGSLKLATMYLQCGQVERGVRLVLQVLQKFTDSTLPYSHHTQKVQRQVDNHEYFHKFLGLGFHVGSFSDMCSNVAMETVFLPCELGSAPPAIREVSRVITLEGDFARCVVLDSLVYAYHLLIVGFSDLQRPADSRRCLLNLKNVVENPRLHHLFHTEVAQWMLQYCIRYLQQH